MIENVMPISWNVQLYLYWMTGMSKFSLRPIRHEGVKARDKKWERENQYQYCVNTYNKRKTIIKNLEKQD
jgi:hypothetical protein